MTSLLFQTCIPLAALIFLGYIIGRKHMIDIKSVATIAIYAITPLVAFGSTARLVFTPALIALPFFTFLMALAIGLISYFVGKRFLDKSESCLLPVACGSGNTGYFGLPIALALFGPDAAGTYFLANLGVVVFETSVGFYFVARGSLTTQEALRRVAGLPVLYALILGVSFAAMGLTLPEAAVKLWELCKGAYVVIGMMIAGLALAQAKGFKLNAKLLGVTLLGKFALWPLAALGFAILDPGLFTPQIHQLVLVLSLAPVAANLPAYAAANGAPVRDSALLVLISTILAVLALPFVLPILL